MVIGDNFSTPAYLTLINNKINIRMVNNANEHLSFLII